LFADREFINPLRYDAAVAFIRLKQVAGKQYAYLVENNWSGSGPRQKVSKYLGRYLELAEAPQLQADANTSDLIRAELHARGFSDKLSKDSIKVDLRRCTIRDGRRRVVLGINGGYLCDHTLRKLLHFIPVQEVTPGYALARAFSDAGIRVRREQFVLIYKKLYKKHSSA
jgi:hypothetical protein